MGRQSIRTRIAIWTGMCLLLTSGVNLALSVFSAREEAMLDAQQVATASAVENMLQIRTVLEKAMFTARGFAQSITATKDQDEGISLSRRQLNLMLRRVMLENPDFVGGSTSWEPNAFDGRDADYANTLGHDASGRISYYWYRKASGGIAMEHMTGIDSEFWYADPLRKKHETLSEPYLYPIEGQQVFMSTVSVPIQVAAQVYGVTTIDVTLGFLQQLVDEANVFDGDGRMSIISNAGVLVAGTGKGELAGKPLTGQPGYSDTLLASVAAGQSYYAWNETGMEIGVPLVVGQNDRPWGIYVQVPAHRVLASVYALMWQELGSGLVSIGIALLLLWGIVTKITTSLQLGTEMAESISRGDLTPRLKLDRSDEVGRLAVAMNRMAESLCDKASQAEVIAASERQQRHALASELETFAQSLQQMTENFTTVLGQVDNHSQQILANSQQVGEISQSLTTEANMQVNLVEQVSAVVSEIVNQLEQQPALNSEASTELSDRLQQVRDVLDQVAWLAQQSIVQSRECFSANEELAEFASAVDHELQRFKFLEQMGAVKPPEER